MHVEEGMEEGYYGRRQKEEGRGLVSYVWKGDCEKGARKKGVNGQSTLIDGGIEGNGNKNGKEKKIKEGKQQ